MSPDPFNTSPPLDDVIVSAAANAKSAVIVRAEERRAMLLELAELGMTLTREVIRRATEAPEEPEPAAADVGTPGPRPASRRDPADSFACLSRAIRLTLALEARIDEDPADPRAGRKNRAPGKPFGGAGPTAADPAAFDEDAWDAYPADYISPLRNKARDNVYDVINHEVTDVYVAHDLLNALYERLSEGELYEAFFHLPMSELVAAICEDLGLHPDWSRWTDDGFPPPRPDIPHHEWEMRWAPLKDRILRKRLQ